MNLLDICLLAVALAMDCFTVSIVSGMLQPNLKVQSSNLKVQSSNLKVQSSNLKVQTSKFRMALLFGLFQALMPLVGWFGISYFSEWIEAYDHWIAFLMLSLIGVNMIREAFGPEDEHALDFSRLSVQMLLAVATSIDALAVGISFACTGYQSLRQLTLPLIIIGATSFLLSILGHWLGSRFGRAVTHRLKPALFGGVILIGIGIKILITHLYHL